MKKIKKQRNLTKNTDLPFTSKETIRNLSSHNLTAEALKFGLAYSIYPPTINTTE